MNWALDPNSFRKTDGHSLKVVFVKSLQWLDIQKVNWKKEVGTLSNLPALWGSATWIYVGNPMPC